ncbi:MAG: homoserine dehydrogenase [Cetobacterium sp.]
MKIALLGFGTVGSGVYEIINSNSTSFLTPISIQKILVKNSSDYSIDITTTDIEEIIHDKEINLVVEAIGGINPAYEYIIKALENKKHVVTSNKAVVALYLDEFLEVAKKNNVQFKFEASVCGGIPWIKSLYETKKIDDISKISGIFNGTTNFILDNMKNKKTNFSETLKVAQELGYAESDPSADIDGFDILRKLQISLNIAFNSKILSEDIDVFGIRNISKTDIEYFEKFNSTIKLIATAKKQKDSFYANVEPVAFKNEKMEAIIPKNFNLGTILGSTIGELRFYGQGAGKFPTGNAVVQDILDIFLQKEVFSSNINIKTFLKKDPSLSKGKYYIRIQNSDFKLKYSQIIKEFFVFNNQNIFITHSIESNYMNLISKEYRNDNLFYVKIDDNTN